MPPLVKSSVGLYTHPVNGTLFDSNVVIEAVNGRQEALQLIDATPGRYISAVSWVEIMVGVEKALYGRAAETLPRFSFLPVDEAVAAEAAFVERRYPVSRMDALVLASARVHGLLLLTNDKTLLHIAGTQARSPY